jgi:pimeloyl-ACP methyl ester carboxylesterase
MPKTSPQPDDYIERLNINGLDGRMLRLPPPDKRHRREILVIYGHHALLERWWGLIQNFNSYGAVTMPDLPGFGGMDSFFTIGKDASLDNFADYLASFIKFHYKRRRLTIVGISFGFAVATRMLQRYPELQPRVDYLISAVGFAHHDDFRFSPRRLRLYRAGTLFFKQPLPALFFRYAVLNGAVLRTFYGRTANGKLKFAGVKGASAKQALMDMEVDLWQSNEVRTYMQTTHEFLRLDNCARRVNLPVWHVASRHDNFFDNHMVEQHMRVIFKDFHVCFINSKSHAPSVLAGKQESAALVPLRLRRELAK